MARPIEARSARKRRDFDIAVEILLRPQTFFVFFFESASARISREGSDSGLIYIVNIVTFKVFQKLLFEI